DDGTDNLWDNGTTGNYWDDYLGVDADNDGIGDTPYLITGSGGSVDNFPIWDNGIDVVIWIYIDGAASGPDAYNWDWAKNQFWCSGSGIISDPYIIKDLIIEGEGRNTGIHITNSRVYFEIKNCTISNFECGIRIENTTNIKIIDSTVFNAKSIGIAISNCSNVYLNANNVSDITDENGENGDLGGYGQPGEHGGDGNNAYGIFLNHSKDIIISRNNVSKIIGGNGGSGGDGGDGISSSSGDG
ncbi:unnamed protein product, partial [marine sediment metagenome]